MISSLSCKHETKKKEKEKGEQKLQKDWETAGICISQKKKNRKKTANFELH